MKIFKRSKSFIALLLALVLAIGTPVTILAEDTVTEESAPAAEESAPAAEESAPAAEESASAESAPEESAPAEQPAAEQPAAEQPAAEQPVAEQPAAEQPAAEQPAAEQPAAEQPVAQPTAAEMPELQPQEEISSEVQPEAEEPEAAPAAEEPAEQPESKQEEQPEEQQSGQAGDVPAGLEPVQGAETPETAPGSIEGSGLTTTIKGIPEDKRQNILERFSNGIPEMIEQKQSAKLVDASLVDAEKYSCDEEGYDHLLCWAATASNMLWISGHAQHAVNPYTNAVFANVDEVFDYFRQNFTDQVGFIQGGLQYFFEGEYFGQGIDGASQLKDEEAENGNLSNAKHDSGIIFQNPGDGSTPDLFGTIGDMVDKTYGLLIKFWNGSSFVGGHAITLVGITEDENETDFTKRYKGVIVADSDNSPVSDAEHTDTPAEQRAALAATADNSYTFLPLTWELLDGRYYWVMEGYSASVRTVILELHWLIDYVTPEPEPEPENKEPEDEKPVDNDNNNNNSSTDDAVKSDPQTFVEAAALEVMQEIDINALKDIMIQNNVLVFSITGTKYQKSQGKDYGLFVRRPYTALTNIYLDGVRLSADGTNFRIVRLPNGLFKVVLSKELLKKLKEGKYTLRLEFDGLDPIDSLIEVE